MSALAEDLHQEPVLDEHNEFEDDDPEALMGEEPVEADDAPGREGEG